MKATSIDLDDDNVENLNISNEENFDYTDNENVESDENTDDNEVITTKSKRVSKII